MYIKKHSRVSFKTNRKSGYKRNHNFSNGKLRNKGNITQQYNKYLKLAKEAFTSGDRIKSEYYYQFTDHYYRLIVELGINFEDNQLNIDNKAEEISNNKAGEVKEELSNDENENQKNLTNENEQEDKNLDSIESVPFISEPVKKRGTKSIK